MIDYRFFPTPQAYTRWLFMQLPILGVCFEPCAGAGDIVLGATEGFIQAASRRWITNDLDPRWGDNDFLGDARSPELYQFMRQEAFGIPELGEAYPPYHIISNPPFDHAEEIVRVAQQQIPGTAGICAMYLRLSFLEPKKTGGHATWLREHPPSCVLPLPRFAHRRNAKGRWGNDSVTCGWFVWAGQYYRALDRPMPPWIFPTPDLFLAIHLETKAYRARVDALTGWPGAAA